MASLEAVKRALKILSRVFAADLTPEKAEVYTLALADLPDAALQAAVERVVREHEGAFFPTPAVIRRAASHDEPVDVSLILKAISKHGNYNPHTGWNPPRVETVREKCGDTVAAAYGAIGGGSRLFSENPTTRDIAERDFATALADERESRPALPSRDTKLLGEGPSGGREGGTT